MSDRRKAMVWAAFAADALALGPHWIYDTAIIKNDFGRVEEYAAPPEGSFHAPKKAGDFTHYGDQTLVLLQSVAEKGGFDLDHFAELWRGLFDGYTGYFDRATKGTLANFDGGKGPRDAGSSSNDLAGAGRIAPLGLAYSGAAEFARAARLQTAMTHNDPAVVDSAEFFALAAHALLEGADMQKAFEQAARDSKAEDTFSKWLERGLASADQDNTKEILKKFGTSCHTPDAFPGVVHLAVKYEDDLREGLVQNVMAGGDSAGRGLLVGMLLGARLGMDALPGSWIDGLAAREQIAGYVDEALEAGGNS